MVFRQTDSQGFWIHKTLQTKPIWDFFLLHFPYLPKLYIGFNITLEKILSEPAMKRIHLFHRFSCLYDAGDLLLYIWCVHLLLRHLFAGDLPLGVKLSKPKPLALLPAMYEQEENFSESRVDWYLLIRVKIHGSQWYRYRGIQRNTHRRTRRGGWGGGGCPLEFF